MPPKLQVDESFAFLFTCIEASGCKIDFKLVGDATDLQPAAARMRYTRLRKAVEAGDFKGATLSQPVVAVVSSRLSQLANPYSRRLGGYSNTATETQQQIQVFPQSSGHKSGSRKRSIPPVNLDEGEREEHEDIDESHLEVDRNHERERYGSVKAESDDGLFFPDTSRTTRDNKRVKRSESVVEVDRPQTHFERRPLGHADDPRRAIATSNADSRRRVYPVTSFQQVEVDENPQQRVGLVDPRATSSGSLRTFEHPPSQSIYTAPVYAHQGTDPSRRKHSANNAAEAAYTVGVQTGRFMPISGNANDVFSHQIVPPDHRPRLGFAGQSIHSQFVNYHDPRSPMSPALQQAFYTGVQSPFSYDYDQSRNLDAGHNYSNQRQYIQKFRSSPVIQHSAPRSRAQQTVASTNTRPRTLHYDINDPDRFHPSYVLKGFRPPSLTREVTPSNTANHSDVSRIPASSGRSSSLLQKVKADRETDSKKTEETYEQKGQGSLTMKQRHSSTPQADSAASPASDPGYNNGRMHDVDNGRPEIKPMADTHHGTQSIQIDTTKTKAANGDVVQSVHEESV